MGCAEAPVALIPVAGIPHPYPERISRTGKRNFHRNLHGHLQAALAVRVPARKPISAERKAASSLAREDPAARTYFTEITSVINSVRRAHAEPRPDFVTVPIPPDKNAAGLCRMAYHEADNAVVSLIRHSAQTSLSTLR